MSSHPTLTPEEFKECLADVILKATKPGASPFKAKSASQSPRPGGISRRARPIVATEELPADSDCTTYRITYAPKAVSSNPIDMVITRSTVRRITYFLAEYKRFDDGREHRVIKFSEQTQVKGKSMDSLEICIEADTTIEGPSAPRITRSRRNFGLIPLDLRCRFSNIPERACECTECDLRRLFSY